MRIDGLGALNFFRFVAQTPHAYDLPPLSIPHLPQCIECRFQVPVDFASLTAQGCNARDWRLVHFNKCIVYFDARCSDNGRINWGQILPPGIFSTMSGYLFTEKTADCQIFFFFTFKNPGIFVEFFSKNVTLIILLLYWKQKCFNGRSGNSQRIFLQDLNRRINRI